MISNIIVVCSVFVSVQCQIFAAPYQRQQAMMPAQMPAMMPAQMPAMMPAPMPAMMPSCPCGGAALATMPVMNIPYEAPVAMPAPRVVTNKPMGCLEPTVTNYGTIAEVPMALPAGLPLANPFLPAASPVSAMAPFSPLLPPANTCSRCQYLKKIPIPPPCI